MISYISIEGNPENGFVRCELELIPAIESKVEDFETKPCSYVDLPVSLFEDFFEHIGHDMGISPGNIFVVEHDNGDVYRVIYKDNAEAALRFDFYDSII